MVDFSLGFPLTCMDFMFSDFFILKSKNVIQDWKTVKVLLLYKNYLFVFILNGIEKPSDKMSGFGCFLNWLVQRNTRA